MSEHAKRIKRELVMKGTILDVYKDTMELPNGKTEEWDFVSHRKGAAAVVAVREDGKLLMVRQYRNALERMTLEIPAGARDSVTEDTKVCAARELEEETGYRSENPVFYLHRSFHTIRLHHVLPRQSLLPHPDAVHSSLNLLQGTHQ